MLVIFYSTSNGKIITIYEIYLHTYVQQLHAKKHPRQISQVALHQKMTPYFFYKDKYVYEYIHIALHTYVFEKRRKKYVGKMPTNCTVY